MRTLILLVCAGCCAWAQTDSDGLSVRASRNAAVPPDQAYLRVDITAGPDKTIDQILAVLHNTKLTVADLTGMSTQNYGLPAVSWTFNAVVKISELSGVAAELTAIQTDFAKTPNNDMGLSFQVYGTQTSTEAMASQQCSYGALFNDAQKQAQKMAAAAGTTAGPAIALSDSGATGIGGVGVASFGYFLVGNIISNPFISPLQAAPTCGLTVQFKLGSQ